MQFFTEKKQLYLPGVSRRYEHSTCSLCAVQKLQLFTEKKQLYLPGVSGRYTHSTCSLCAVQKLQFFTEKRRLYLPVVSRKYTRSTCRFCAVQNLQLFTEKRQLYLPGVSRRYTHSTCSVCAVQKLQFFPLAKKPSLTHAETLKGRVPPLFPLSEKFALTQKPSKEALLLTPRNPPSFIPFRLLAKSPRAQRPRFPSKAAIIERTPFACAR